MAHYFHKNKFHKRPGNLERMSRIPFNEESIEPYIITPSLTSLEDDLLSLLNQLIVETPDCVDGQNGNVLDEYIQSWEKLAIANLNSQKVFHKEKTSILSNIRNSTQRNAQDWLRFEEEELAVINQKIAETEKKNDEFHSEVKSQHRKENT